MRGSTSFFGHTKESFFNEKRRPGTCKALKVQNIRFCLAEFRGCPGLEADIKSWLPKPGKRPQFEAGAGHAYRGLASPGGGEFSTIRVFG